jgi:adenylyltransferase/sulfurtransferase
VEGAVIVACRSGNRSATVVQFLLRNGVPGAVNLEGGIVAWGNRIDPSVPRY